MSRTNISDDIGKEDKETNESLNTNGERSKKSVKVSSETSTAADIHQLSASLNSVQNQTDFDIAAALLALHGYELGEKLGKGSYAIVRAATSKKLKKRVAVKIISKKKAPIDYLSKFLPREIYVLKKLRHKHCIRLLDEIETAKNIYVITNVAENGNLLQYIRQHGAIQEGEARKYFHHIISAIEYVHSLGIVHRDLKCENLLLDVNFNIVVSDFGFAREQTINAETGMCNLSETFCGSYAYAPPEILKGIPYDGVIADIWSIGVILYTMVSGRLPFDDSNLRTLHKQVMKPVYFSSRKQLSLEVKNLIGKLLHPNVEKRATIKIIKEHSWFKGESFL